MTRLAVIADIHGNLPALEAVLADIARQSADITIDLGDCVSGPLWPRETYERLRQCTFPTVRGNHDRALGRPLRSLGPSDAFAAAALAGTPYSWEALAEAELPPAACRELALLPPILEPMPGVLACHGTPASDLTYLLEVVEDGALSLAAHDTIAGRLGTNAPALVLCAHSHQQRAVRCADTLIVNPGSVGCPAYLDDGEPYHVSETESPHARYAILDDSQGLWSIEFRALVYDWDSAAAQARRNGREEWARALKTGRIR